MWTVIVFTAVMSSQFDCLLVIRMVACVHISLLVLFSSEQPWHSLLLPHPDLVVCWSPDPWYGLTAVYWWCLHVNSHDVHFYHLIPTCGHQTHGMCWQHFIADVHIWTAMTFTSITSSQFVVTRPMACVHSSLSVMFTYEQPQRSLLSPHPNLIVCWSPEQCHLSTAVGKPGNPFLVHTAGKYLSMFWNALLFFLLSKVLENRSPVPVFFSPFEWSSLSDGPWRWVRSGEVYDKV